MCPAHWIMKKIIIPPAIITVLVQRHSFLDRADVQIFTADSNEEALDIHREEKTHLIIAHFARTGMSSQQFCSRIRGEAELSAVSIIIVCANIRSDIQECAACKANAVLTRPLDAPMLIAKAQDLLSISTRASFRVLLSVAVEGTIRNTPFFCRSVNISTTGMLIETDQVLAEGDRLACSFFLPMGPQIQAAAVVVRGMKSAQGFGAYEYGVRFSSLTSEARQALKAFLVTKESP